MSAPTVSETQPSTSFFNRLGLKPRLIATLVFASLLAAVLVGGSTLYIAEKNMKEAAEDNVAEAAAASSRSLQQYIDLTLGDLTYMAEQVQIQNDVQVMSQAYQNVGGESLQRIFIHENPNPSGEKHLMHDAKGVTGEHVTYNVAHRRTHRSLVTVMEERGYYDIFLIDAQGNIVYSVFKELDYATNLVNGEYSSSGLGTAFRSAIGAPAGQHTAVDFEPYSPSAGAPAAFFAIPIYAEGLFGAEAERIGVVAIQVPVDRLTAATTRGVEDAETMSFIVGTDGTLRSEVEATEGSDVLSASFDASGISAGEGAVHVPDLLGRQSIVAAQSLSFLGIEWMVVSSVTEH